MIVVFLSGAAVGAPGITAEKDRKPAPDFALKDANGATVRLSDFKGKVVLLDFWATFCGPCKVEIPWFMDFEQTLKSRGLVVVGVAMDDGWDLVRLWMQQRKMNYRVVLGDDRAGDLYGGVEALPTTFLIDRQGRIAAMHLGLAISKDGFRNEITQLLDAGGAGAQHAGGAVPRTSAK